MIIVYRRFVGTAWECGELLRLSIASRKRTSTRTRQCATAGITASSVQPDPKQAHKGTVVHRRWDGGKAGAMAANGFFDLDVQREADDGDTPANFALVITLEMLGEVVVYNQVLNRVAVKPVVPVLV
jgi:hypothetical protein